MIDISVITPVYNSIQFIEDCILNVINQKAINVEHLIVDGGSNDGTLEVIQHFSKEYPHIRFLSEKDNGQSDAMNKGIDLAKGRFISFLNVDDYYEEGALKDVLSKISSNSNLDFLVGNCNVWDNNDKLIYVNRPKKLKTAHLLSGYYLPVNPSAYFYKRELHENIGKYDVNNHYVMDIDFLIRASLKVSLKYYDVTWGNFRMLENTKTVSDQKEGLAITRKYDLYKMYLKSQGVKLRLEVCFIRLTKCSQKYLFRIKKKIVLPFDMVYWKLKKIWKV